MDATEIEELSFHDRFEAAEARNPFKGKVLAAGDASNQRQQGKASPEVPRLLIQREIRLPVKGEDPQNAGMLSLKNRDDVPKEQGRCCEANLTCPPKTDPTFMLGFRQGDRSNATKELHHRTDH